MDSLIVDHRRYILMQSWPTVFYVWVLYIVSVMGRKCGSDNFIIQCLQVLIVVGWPYVFVYMIGPFFTAIVVAIPQFLFWIKSFFDSPKTAAADGVAWTTALPKNVTAWFENYFYELRRDLGLLKACISDIAVEVHKAAIWTVFALIGFVRTIKESNFLSTSPETDNLLASKAAKSTRLAPGDYGSAAARV